MSNSQVTALIVEDNPEHELLLRSLLETSHSPVFSVTSVGTAAEACERLSAGGVQVVLLDLNLPDSKGIQTFERVVAVAQEVPIVVLSGTGDVTLAVQTVQLGAQDYLLKGHVENHLLFRSIQYAIERKRAQVDLRRAYDDLEQRVSERTAALREANDALQRQVEVRKRAEAASLESNKQLMEALSELRAMQHEIVQRERFKVLGQMASGIAHEFNNVLTPMLGYAEHLLNHPAMLADVECVRDHLAKIVAAARTGAKAIVRVRDFARTEAGERGPVKVGDVVQGAVSITEPLWKDEALKAGKTILMAQKVGDVPEVLGNAGQLRELLMQLIINAVVAIEKRGMITISAERNNGSVAISVEDNGSGMSESARLRLCEPVQGILSGAVRMSGYTGIHTILKRHGASLEIQSAEGVGTKVTVLIPAVPFSELIAPPLAPEGPQYSSARILVADDEPMVRDIICMFLQEDGHVVDVAENGRQAFEMFCKADYDLVLSDLAMPEMNGDQLAAVVKERNPKMPVVLLTGFGDAMNEVDERPRGVDAVVAKPFTMAILREALAEFLVK